MTDAAAVVTLEEVDRLADEAATLFGPRDRSYRLTNIVFDARGPFIRYGAEGEVLVILSENARNYRPTAMFEAAHEAVHLLAPTGGSHASVLEEGLATHFSHLICDRISFRHRTTVTSFVEAERLAKQLLALKTDAVAQVRAAQPRFDRISPEALIAAAPKLNAQTAATLCLPFASWSEHLGGIGRTI